MKKRASVFITDCEGPLVLNDYARELAQQNIPQGDRLFQQLSTFDDYTAYVRQREHYNAGDTLRILSPFLKAYNLTNEKFRTWIKKNNIHWMNGATQIARILKEAEIPMFEVTSSYYPVAQHVAKTIGIPLDHVYCTDFDLDRHYMTFHEKSLLQQLAQEIIAMPELPPIDMNRTSILEHSEDFTRIEEIIWKEVVSLSCSSQLLSSMRSMGGEEKANAIRDIIIRTGTSPEQAIYVGDSIVDVEAFRTLNAYGGTTISFNGDSHAVSNARYCSWGTTSLINALATFSLVNHGVEGVQSFFEHPERISHDSMVNCGVAVRTPSNVEELIEKSRAYRQLH